MKKIAVLVIFLSILLNGCWDSIDPEKLGLVTLMGIDTARNNQFKVVVLEFPYQSQASGGKNEGGSKMPGKLHESFASTISEAVQMIITSDFLRTYFAHTSAVILSEELVSSKEIFSSFIDHLERNPEIRRNTWLLIAEKGQFDKVFSTGSDVEPGIDAGRVISEIIRNKSEYSSLAANNLGEFLNLYWETGSEPFTSGISLIKVNAGKKNHSGNTDIDESNSYDFNIRNTAVFENDKLAGWLNTSESIGLLWVKGGVKGGTLPVKLDGKILSVEIISADSRIKPVLVDGAVQIGIHINLESILAESQANIDFENEEVIKRIENLQALEVKKQILAAFNKTKSLNSDVFGFGNYIFGKYPDYWKEVEDNQYDYYQNLELNIDISSTVNQIGLVRKSKK